MNIELSATSGYFFFIVLFFARHDNAISRIKVPSIKSADKRQGRRITYDDG